MTKPDLTGLRRDVVDYIEYIEEGSARELKQRDERIAQLEERVADVTQMLQNLQRLYFGKKSEKIRIRAPEEDGQLSMFDASEPEPGSVPEPAEPEPVEVSGHKRRRKRTQEEIIADLPVVLHEHTLAEHERKCPRCGSEELECIGRELAYTEYVRVPAHIDRHEHWISKYACRRCEDGTEKCMDCERADMETCRQCPDRPGMTVIAAKLPEEFKHPLIKGSKANSTIISQIYYDKFDLALPMYRQEKEWERLGFPLSRQTMSNWILRVDRDYIRAMTAYMLKALKESAKVVNCDETPVKVLDEKTDKGEVRKCHMWVVRTGKYEPRQIVIFSYSTTRGGNVPVDILSGYGGYFVSDGYAGYNELEREAVRCGCWAHVRRKFYDSIPGHDMGLKSLGREGVKYCDRLFRIEEKLEKVSHEERLKVRNDESRKVIDEFYTWLDTLDPANKKQEEAKNYAIKQKEALTRFLKDGRIPLSNNAAENAIRPFVVGRKNWLFCKSHDGAIAAANAYSLVETAKANGLDVLKYLNIVFRRIPLAGGDLTDIYLESLMPWSPAIQAECGRGRRMPQGKR